MLSPEECTERLKRATCSEPTGIDQWQSIATGEAQSSGLDFIGRIGYSSFSVRLLSGTRNSFHPRLHGKLSAASGGSESHTTLRLAVAVRAFVAVVSVFLVVFGVFTISAGYNVPGIAALVLFGLVWAVVGIGVSLAGNEDARLLERFLALLDGDVLP